MGNGRRRRRRAAFRAKVEGLPRRLMSMLAHVTEPPRQPEVKAQDFADYLVSVHKDKLSLADQELARARDLIREAEGTLRTLEQNPNRLGPADLVRRKGEIRTLMIRLQGRLDVALIEHGALDTFKMQLQEQYQAILAVPRILDVSVKPPRLVYWTDVLYGKDADNIWHRVGRFEISFDLINPKRESFTWQNLDGSISRENSVMEGPPNIYRLQGQNVGTVTCLGTAQGAIDKARESFDYSALVAISVRYPECKGNSNAITDWPAVSLSEVPQWYLDTFGV